MKKTAYKIDELGSSSLYIYKYELSEICEDNYPTVYIQANVHGAEVQGNAAIWKLVEKLQSSEIEVLGKIILVPQANPYGSSQKLGTYTYGRFNPITGDNWNRMYIDFFAQKTGQGLINLEQFVAEHGHKSQEQITSLYKDLIREKIDEYKQFHLPYGVSDNKNLFLKLQEMASEADIVLDLHTGPVATRYIYSPEYLETQSRDLNFPHYLIIPNEFGGAMDEATFVPWFKLYQELKKKNITLDHLFESYTVELGSEEYISMKDASEDANNILHYLQKRGVIKGFKHPQLLAPKEQYYCPLSDYRMYRAPCAGLIEYHVKPGEHFEQNHLMATIYRFDKLEDLESSQTEIRANSRGIVINHTPSSIIKQGMDLIECFTYK